MASSLTQTTVDHRNATALPCHIELGLIVESSRGKDKELAQECSDMINRCFQAQSDAEALSERIKTGMIADYEMRRVDQLLLKANLENELQGLNRQATEYQNELARINGQLQNAINRLNDHLGTKKSLIPALLLPKDQQAWETKRDQLQAKVDEVRAQQADLNLTISVHNRDLESLAYRIKAAAGNAIACFHRISRLKGDSAPIYEPGSHGLAI
jgi:chromosome segregation ATPase